MTTIIALLKKDYRLHFWLFGVYWFALIVNVSVFFFYSGNDLANEGTYYLFSLQGFAVGLTASIYSIDNSDPNSHWRTLPVSALQLCLAKLLLVFLFIILPTVVSHWFVVKSLIQEPHQYWVLEPLIHFLNFNLCAALVGATFSRSKPMLFIVCLMLGLALEFFYIFWLSAHFQTTSLLPIFEGDHATILSIGMTVLLLIILWFIYLRRNITYNIPVAAMALLSCWFFFKTIGPWVTTSSSPQPKQLSEQASLTATDVHFNFFKSFEPSHSASSEYRMIATISPPKPELQNYVFTSRGYLSNQAGFKRYFGSSDRYGYFGSSNRYSYFGSSDRYRSGFDDGEFTFVHTQLGFASEKDRRFNGVQVAYINDLKQDRWNKSASTLNMQLTYSEPVVSIIADEPALVDSEVSYQNHKFLLNSRILNNGTLALSFKGYSLNDFFPGIIVYRPDLKELLHINVRGRVRSSSKLILSRPKISLINSIGSPIFVPKRVHFSEGNSLGYRSLSSHPNKEWLAKARVMVYIVNYTKPIVEKLTIEK